MSNGLSFFGVLELFFFETPSRLFSKKLPPHAIIIRIINNGKTPVLPIVFIINIYKLWQTKSSIKSTANWRTTP